MDYNFTEGAQYLGLIIETKRSNNWKEKSCLILNYISDNGHLSHYYFFCDISPEVSSYKFKMFPGQLVTFEVTLQPTGFYKYTAHSLTLVEESKDYLEIVSKSERSNLMKNFCLFFDNNSLKNKIEEHINSLEINVDFFKKLTCSELLAQVIENSKVEVRAWGRNKPGDDDSWGAYLESDFGCFNDKLHSYFNTKFRVDKEIFSDRGFCSYRRELDQYIGSYKYLEDQKNALIETEILKSRLLSDYNFEDHKASYFIALKNHRNSELQKIFINLNSSWEYIYSQVKFSDYYKKRYHQKAFLLIKRISRKRFMNPL